MLGEGEGRSAGYRCPNTELRCQGRSGDPPT